jgi:hypothetical protein
MVENRCPNGHIVLNNITFMATTSAGTTTQTGYVYIDVSKSERAPVPLVFYEAFREGELEL